ncbi:MAG: FAD-dependent thymidylate synthase [Deltaproteobacteria bacterium RBG_19FT_COMBO_58_16]|nr:MAG: FAD-dependent thymidylate synthase [Deltaproteobacteria bacterium RBG_19FT_COMBO_58_16]
MNVTLLNFTPEPEKTVTLAARLCYSDSSIAELEEKVENLSKEKFLGRILKMGHLSVLEHVSFTFGAEGISRATSHQLVRHRLASYSQQSQRYVTSKRPEFVTPGSISADPEKEKRFNGAVRRLYKLYGELVEGGVPPEDARFLLPNAAATKIIITMNARELLHFYRLRCCERAQWEIRDMATRMLALAKEKAPFIFKDAGPACVKGACSEGDMTCGKPREIRQKFRNL